VWTVATGVFVVLVLTIAPTSAVYQLAQYVNGSGDDADSPRSAFIAGIVSNLDAEFLPYATEYDTLRSDPPPLAVFANEAEAGVKTEDISSSVLDAAYEDHGFLIPESGEVFELLDEPVATTGFTEEFASLMQIFHEFPVGALLAGEYAAAAPQAMIISLPHAFPDQGQWHEFAAATDEPPITSSIFTMYPGTVESASHGEEPSGDHGYEERLSLFEDEESETTPQLPIVSASGYIWPANGTLSSRFGYRTSSIGSTRHLGIDISGSSGTPIYAVADGEVIVAGRSSSFGHMIKIRHDNDHITLYAHCSALLVSIGERVEQGQQIAEMGRTGIASGVHLHFELIINGVNVDPLRHMP